MSLSLRPHGPLRILMTVDAVGGVWRYAMDLAAALRLSGIETVFAGFGPPPSDMQAEEAKTIGRLLWCDAPLDWMVEREAELQTIAGILQTLVRQERVDLLHLNLPSQAVDLDLPVPVVVVSHSCVGSWFRAVRGHDVPETWRWQLERNARGFQQADLVISPSRSHAELLGRVYGWIERLEVVHNASAVCPAAGDRQPMVFAAGRWWDDGKNGAVLDAAAADTVWPVVMAGATRGPNGQHLALRHAQGRAEISHAEVLAHMRHAAICVSPSLYEPFGLAALEAARCGCALVLADIATYRELWEGAALFADPRDPSAFADALNRLAGDAGLRDDLAARALEASKRFTPEAQSGALVSLYRRLLSSTPVLGAAE